MARLDAAHSAKKFRFLHISTDEVFGSLGRERLFYGSHRLRAELALFGKQGVVRSSGPRLARNLWAADLITNWSNNYGPYQFPEKLIPHMIIRGLAGESLPVYGEARTSATGSMLRTTRRLLRSYLSVALSGRPTILGDAMSEQICRW